MNYFILNFNVLPNSYFAEKGKMIDQSIIRKSFKGLKLKENPEIELGKFSGNLLNHIDNLFGIPIVSQKVIDIIKKYDAKKVDYYNVKFTEKIKEAYFFINILDNLDCVNYEQSEYILYTPASKVFKSVKKLVLNKDQIKRHIFRINAIKTTIVISEPLKIALEKLHLKEFALTSIEEYQE